MAQEPDRVVINEIHYNPDITIELVEFVELYNRTNATVNLSGWRLDGAIEFVIPEGTVLNPGQMVVIGQDPGALRAKYGVDALGPYVGKLANEGEELILRSDAGPRVDAVDFEDGFPWPVVGAAPGHSIQLLNPDLDNGQAGHWRAAPPTPGHRNNGYSENPPPRIEVAGHMPEAPTSRDAVTISAAIADDDGVAAATLLYQLVAPGNYIPINTSAYGQQWSPLPMTLGEDGLYHTTLPAEMQRHRHLIRYRIMAQDGTGQVVQVPHAEDPQPNFAYFVYDGVPTWSGSNDGGGNGIVTYDFTQMRDLPVYHLIARQDDVADALFMPDTPRPFGYPGNDYLWYGTLVYDGVVYDHISFRARGGLTRYAAGKNMWKLNFNRSHRFAARDNYDRAYDVAWDKLNLSAVIQQTHRGYRGEQGMFESMSFRLFNLAGVESPNTHFIHFRVIDDAEERPANQYRGDFWGLYLAIEQMDGRFLEEHGLPNGNLYKMEEGATETNNQGPSSLGNWDDLWYFINTYFTNPSEEWWRQHLDLERFYAYRAVIEAVRHYDINQGKNYFYYFNPESSRWSVHPWDVDLTWADGLAGDGQDHFAPRVLTQPAFNLEYQNTLRAVRDLLFNVEQMNWMLDEHASFINTPVAGPAMVDADRALWDHNPIFGTRYVDNERTAPGQFYAAAPTRDFPGMVQLMRDWVVSRSQWIDATLLTDSDHPLTPTVAYSGAAGFPVDGLRFTAGSFDDPQGADTFGAMQWRIAQVTDPVAPGFNPAAPRLYEIDAAYESPRLAAFAPDFAPPPGTVQADALYRVRVRMQDATGRWSHWSPPVQFRAAPPNAPAQSALRISEIMYHPPALPGLDDSRLEFLELTNAGGSALDLSHVRVAGAIDYTFAEGARLGRGNYLVLASDEHAFFDRYGFYPFDEYDRQLSNGGERIALLDALGREITAVAYDDKAPWPTEADGDASLVINQIAGAADDAANWRASLLAEGSPGAADPLPILINELQPRPSASSPARFELYNPSNHEADLSHWRVTDNRVETPDLFLPAGTLIGPRGYSVFDAGNLDGQGDTLLRFALEGGKLMLRSSAADGRATGYQTEVEFQGFGNGLSYGRHLTSDGRTYFVPQAEPTLGRSNSLPREGRLIISELMYHPAGGDEYIEITNVSNELVKLYDPDQPSRTWRLDGALFTFPTGLELEPGGKLLLVANHPAEICVDRQVAPGTRVIGPLGSAFPNEGATLALVRPGGEATGDIRPYIVEDLVAYDDAAPWPSEAAGRGATLLRTEPRGFGSEPSHWRAGYEAAQLLRLAEDDPYVQLCTFNAAFQDEEMAVTIDWVSSAEANISGFNLWRGLVSQTDAMTLLTPEGLPATGGAANKRYSFTDSFADLYDGDAAAAGAAEEVLADMIYRLEAIGADGEAVDLAVTEPVRTMRKTYVPFIAR